MHIRLAAHWAMGIKARKTVKAVAANTGFAAL